MTSRMTRQLAGGGDLERRDEADRCRNFVRSQLIVTDLQDLALEVADVGAGLCLQDDIRGDERPGHGAFPGSYPRHADRWMPVDRRFDFLRIDLQATDVDEAAAPAEEVVPVAA